MCIFSLLSSSTILNIFWQSVQVMCLMWPPFCINNTISQRDGRIWSVTLVNVRNTSGTIRASRRGTYVVIFVTQMLWLIVHPNTRADGASACAESWCSLYTFYSHTILYSTTFFPRSNILRFSSVLLSYPLFSYTHRWESITSHACLQDSQTFQDVTCKPFSKQSHFEPCMFKSQSQPCSAWKSAPQHFDTFSFPCSISLEIILIASFCFP